MWHILKRRNQCLRAVNVRDMEDAEFDFQIRREEIELARQNDAGTGGADDDGRA